MILDMILNLMEQSGFAFIFRCKPGECVLNVWTDTEELEFQGATVREVTRKAQQAFVAPPELKDHATNKTESL